MRDALQALAHVLKERLAAEGNVHLSTKQLIEVIENAVILLPNKSTKEGNINDSSK